MRCVKQGDEEEQPWDGGWYWEEAEELLLPSVCVCEETHGGVEQSITAGLIECWRIEGCSLVAPPSPHPPDHTAFWEESLCKHSFFIVKMSFHCF